MTSIGWSLNDLAPTIQTYYINNSPDTWGGFDVTGDLTERSIVVTPTSCSVASVDIEYTNYCRTCTTSENTIVRECCNWGGQFVNECDYGITLESTRDGGFEFPLTDGIITINGLDVAIATMNGINDLIDYLEGLGFLQQVLNLYR